MGVAVCKRRSRCRNGTGWPERPSVTILPAPVVIHSDSTGKAVSCLILFLFRSCLKAFACSLNVNTCTGLVQWISLSHLQDDFFLIYLSDHG